MDRKQILLTLLIILIIDLLRTAGVFDAIWAAFVYQTAVIGKNWILPRIFPDGLLSIGALLVLKQHLSERVKTIIESLKLKIHDGWSSRD